MSDNEQTAAPFNIASGVWWCKRGGMKAILIVLFTLVLGLGCGKSDAERRKEEIEKIKRNIESLEKAHKAAKDLNDAKRRR